VHLLVVTDGSCPAAELRPVLALLARPTRVTLLAVAELPAGGLGPPDSVLDPAPTPPPAAFTDRLTATALRDGLLACEELRESFGVDVEVVSECGDLDELVGTHAARRGAQLVILAGWRNQPRLRNAAVTAVQRDASRPILLPP
jgi:hypothetical protein